MTRILVTSTPGIGHLGTVLPLARALQDADNEVLVVTAEESIELVRRQGFAARAGGMSVAARQQAFEPHRAEVMAMPPRERRGMFFSGFFAEAAAPVMRDALVPVFDEFAPDLVIHEAGELAAAPMAVARGIPHVTAAFSGPLPAAAVPLALRTIAPTWAAEGLDPPTLQAMHGDLYLHPFPPSFGGAPDGVRALAMRTQPLTPSAATDIDWLDSLGSARPLVYMTSGTERAGTTGPWAAGIEALGSLEVDAVATIGPHLDEALLGIVPPNVRVERFVPQAPILERAAVVMSHGGAGSLLGAAGAGRPQLIYPLAADQWDNADTAAGAGVAITCEVDQRSAADIAARVERLLHDVDLAANAQRVAAEIAAMPSPHEVVAAVLALTRSTGA